MRPLIKLLLYTVGMLICCSSATAQTSISPTRVLMSSRDKSTEVSVSNPNNYPIEIVASFGFALMRSDSNGTMVLDSNVLSPDESAKSCEEWLKVSPRRFVLGPNSSKVVRVLVTPPSGISDGEYWGRLKFTSQPLLPAEEIDTNRTEFGTVITLLLATDIPVLFRKGRVATGIEFNVARVNIDSSRARILVDTRRLGNSAYRGTFFGVIRTAGGAEIARVEEQFTTEFALRKSLSFRIPGDGSYHLSIECRSVRTGNAADVAIPAETRVKQYTMTVAGREVSLMPE